MSKTVQTLLCWHAKGAGIEVLGKAIRGLRRHNVRITRVIYLIQTGLEVEIPDAVEKAIVTRVLLELDDPTIHTKIYELIKKNVLPQLQSMEGPLHINVSPGTPAMHAVWLVLHAGGGFPEGTCLWSSQFSPESKRTSIRTVDFTITTYLSQIRQLQRALPERAVYEPEDASPERRAALERLARYSEVTGAPLLILGERGTGKTRLVETLVATLKSGKHVISVACGGLDSELAESLLFGHSKGAFTGAVTDRPGLLAQADDGILFLDEVQDLPKNVQRKLVRVFQDRQRCYRPIGSDRELSVDVELVCASNLAEMDLRAQLDADLLDRLSHLVVRIPSLRECRQDIRTDWSKVWIELRHRNDLPEKAPWTPKLRSLLNDHPLPGNLRDLQRLAVLIMAWWNASDLDITLTNAVVDWQRWSPETTNAEQEFGSGPRTERIKLFKARLALQAKSEHHTWVRAAAALNCDEGTLRDDAKYDKENRII